MGGAFLHDRTEAAVVAHLADDLPVLLTGGRRGALVVLDGAVAVEQVLLGDAHDGFTFQNNCHLSGTLGSTGSRVGTREWRPGPVVSSSGPLTTDCARRRAVVAPIDTRRQSAAAMSVARCTMGP